MDQGTAEIHPAPPALPQLAAEHTALDSQLQALHRKLHLTVAEELEAVRLKKLKLQIKDTMQVLMRQAPAQS